MKFEVLMSCMFQKDPSLVFESGITGDITVINQCNEDGYSEFKNSQGTIFFYSSTQRGLTRSRNMAIKKSDADVCLLCDDDERFLKDYQEKIINAYKALPSADVIIFKMENQRCSFKDKIMRLRFPKTMKVSSWQISFRRERLLQSGVYFDELLGAGTGNGAEEELKFLTDCEKAGLQIWYVPEVIAAVAQEKSTWFRGFTAQFFENRGATTRYILGLPLASVYAIYYIVKKREMYAMDISSAAALKAIFKGILENKITKQAKKEGL